MVERTRFVFSGSGGQGVVTAAIILAEAAVLFENLNAVQTQVYGAAARGGATRSEVIISNSEIFFPKVNQPNVLICLTQDAYNKFSHIIRPGGLLITDTHYVKTERTVDAMLKEFPMYQTVIDKIGNQIVFNICMLGVLIGLTGIVRSESVMKVLEKQISPGFIEMNRKALDLGLNLSEGKKK